MLFHIIHLGAPAGVTLLQACRHRGYMDKAVLAACPKQVLFIGDSVAVKMWE
jgi:hypothetical protein